MVKDLINVVGNIQLNGSVISTKDDRYKVKTSENSPTNYECNDNCDCYQGDCICTDCQNCDE